jgi:hypothetical protein
MDFLRTLKKRRPRQQVRARVSAVHLLGVDQRGRVAGGYSEGLKATLRHTGTHKD